MIEELCDHGLLVWFVEAHERAGELGLRGVLEVLDVLANDLPVNNEVPLPVAHVRNHEHLVDLRLRELERRLGALDVEGQHPRLRLLHHVLETLHHDVPLGRALHVVPRPRADVLVDGDADVVGHVVLAHVHHHLQHVVRHRVAPRPQLVRRVRPRPLLVPLHDGLDEAAPLHQVVHVAEGQLDVAIERPRQVVRHLQVLLGHHRHGRQHPLHPPLQDRQHVLHVAVLHEQVKVRLEAQRRLERAPVLLQKVQRQRRQLVPGDDHRRALHV